MSQLEQEFTCIGKTRFPSKACAHRHLEHLARSRPPRDQQGRGKIQAYRCPFCAWWHVGHERARGHRRHRTGRD